MNLRLLIGVTMAGALTLGGARPAVADPPGPTDYQSEILSVEPDVDGIALEIIGGDSFVRLTSSLDSTVVVLGYDGEPYLRFLPDGTVERNESSPATYLNEDRFGDSDLPTWASAESAPDWIVVAAGGSYAWHDHRAHWMNRSRPPGASPGDRILEGVIPLTVDGREVDVGVGSTWIPSPSNLAAIAGLGLGLALVMGARGRSGSTVASVTLGVATLALATGVIAYRSVPPETGPSPIVWAVPATAVLLTMVARFPRVMGLSALSTSQAVLLPVLVAAVEIGAWGVGRRDWMWRSVLPTDLPFWIDRVVVGTAMVGGFGIAATVAATMVGARNARS